MNLNLESLNLDTIRQRVNLPALCLHFGLNPQHNLNCLWHKDDDPSLQVFADHAYCHGCKKVFDCFSFVMKFEKLNFAAAVQWLLNHEKILPESVALKAPASYKGPVPLKWIEHWHNALTDERMEYLESRLITRKTADELMLGYNADKMAYTIPFWSGVPHWSDVETFQYRAAPQYQGKLRYWGENGYTKPSIINRDLWNENLLLIFFGTLDAVLARQDGLPAWSTNGAGVFSNPGRIEFHEFKQSLLGVKRVVIIPDSTMSEFEPAYKMYNQLIWEANVEIKFFPLSCGVKDYTEYRLQKTAESFLEEVLQMTTVDGLVYALKNEAHVQDLKNMLACVSEGDFVKAFEIMQVVACSEQTWFGAVSHGLRMAAVLGPNVYGGTFSSAEWSEMISKLEDTKSYTDIGWVLKEYADLAISKLGGF